MRHSNTVSTFLGAMIASVAMLATSVKAEAPPTVGSASHTQIVLLGTGNPNPDPDRWGPATAIVVNGTPYLVDMGSGVVRRAKSAVVDKGITALEPVNFRVVFVTHLHSDHTIGYADLIFTPWIYGRRVPLEVYGPPGIKAMTEHLLEAYSTDIEERTKENAAGLYTIGTFPGGYRVNPHEIDAGVVYKDPNITVTAFKTNHALPSFGYRFDTPDRSIVISGDTTPTQATIDACNGCDVLMHEVQTLEWLGRRPDFQAYAAKFHTTTVQLAELAQKARPRLLILYHASITLRPAVNPKASSPEELLSEMTSRYSGHVVVGRDLDVY
ncbi:MAG TPA: MBL fold metallo-hydrolase [Steroidobacteraceae bacterium]|nr:MBL fold metallo-hydrolase [Steroidobacteraceae bacterium]